MPIQNVTDSLRAENYMRGQLSGGTTLARLALNRIDLSAGRFRIPMPETVDQREPIDYRHESVILGHDEEMCFARVVKSFIRDSKCAVLMQDTQLSTSDPGFRQMPQDRLILVYRKEVYWSVRGRELAELPDRKMLEIVWTASFWPFAGFFYVGALSQGKELLSDRDIDDVVDGLVGIAVGAFDERSFLIWWRDELRPFPAVPELE